MSAKHSQSESDEFLADAIKELERDEASGDNALAKNVSEVADWAVQVDEGFANVHYGLTNLEKEHGSDFPELAGFLREWDGYNKRWTTYLLTSRDIASKQAAVLQRFDKVFLEMVQEIKTDQDRKEAIIELEAFAKEPNGDSADMAKNFKGLSTDIKAYEVRFDAWIERTGTELKEQAKELQKQISELQAKIKDLDVQIIAATAALLASLAEAATIVGIIGLVVAGTTLALLIYQRVEATKDLLKAQKDLEEVNRKQVALAHIKSTFDGLKPDIAIICERLILFGEIWSSIHGQTLHFVETLKKGLDATTTPRFKKEVTLARKLCTPLRNGLEKYATQLGKRKLK